MTEKEAQEAVWNTVFEILRDYESYHSKGPENCKENAAPLLAVRHIIQDMEIARGFGIPSIKAWK